MQSNIAPLAKPFEFKGTSNPIVQVILIHGFTASPTEVKPLGEFLFKKSNESILIRSLLLPGHGVAGPEGFKALDNVTLADWKQFITTKIESFANEYSCPVIVAGLSMGAVLTIYFLHSITQDQKYLAGILLSPALSISNRLFPYVKYLKYIKGYTYKGKDSELFFKQHNLFSYPSRSLKASDEFRKLLKEIKPLIKDIKKPILSYTAEGDDSVNIDITNSLLQKNSNIIIKKMPKMGHIITVYPESETMFNEIYAWIMNLPALQEKSLLNREI